MGTMLIRGCRRLVTLICLLAIIPLTGSPSLGLETAYVFHGHFTPTDRRPSPALAPASPDELMGLPFTARIAWPKSSEPYSEDWQTGTDHWGSYTTEAISIELAVAGLAFVAAPLVSQWETLNDTPLGYHYGTALTWGDELRLVGGANLTQTTSVEAHFGGETRQESLTRVTDYMVTLRASDYGGDLVADDALQTQFDLTAFDYVRFEFQQIVPVASMDPRPIGFQHFLGTIDSIVLVPEPASYGLGFLAILGSGVLRRRA